VPAILLGTAAALFLSAAAIAAPASKSGSPKAALAAAQPGKPAKPVVLADFYTMADRAVDPMVGTLRAILTNVDGQGDFLDKRDVGALTEFYRQQGNALSWIVDGKLGDRALAVMARIRQADSDGLDPSAYHLPHAQIGLAMPATMEAQARADVMLSQAVADYVRDAHSGRLDPAAISENFSYAPHVADPVEALTKISTAEDAPAVLASYNPARPEFAALRDALAKVRAEEASRPPVIPAGPNLKPGARDPRVPILRVRLDVPTPEAKPAEEPAETTASVTPASADASVTVDAMAAEPAAPVDPNVYDDATVAAVKAFQESAGLKPDGIVGPGTLARLNAAAVDHAATIIANMERWRWMPEKLGDLYVRVNIPNFNLDIYKNGKVFYTTRIVVGQPTKQTPIFSDEIEHVIVNPTWNVPASIAVKEMLPQIQANPGQALNGYQVFANIGGRFRAVDPWMVDWHNVDMRQIQIKQPPGERNALGSVKFMFPNPYAVYLHDTPSKSLFLKDYRAYSHGCMRVMNPWEFAAALLTYDPNVSADSIHKLVGGPERQVNLTRHIPVHITYFTAWVDGDGKLQIRDDVYGHDKRVEKALGLTS
jgi:murein L,D-transpeptidase YcbB/YkuD